MRPTIPFGLPDFGIHLPDLPELPLQRAMREKSAEIVQRATQLTCLAITTWATQAGMTPEQWLQVFDYVVSMKPGDKPATIVITVSAKMRDEGDNPYEFTVTV